MTKKETLTVVNNRPDARHPEIAEAHDLRDYIIAVRYDVKSKFVEGISSKKMSCFIVCPGCRSMNRDPIHGHVYHCTCGLYLRPLGEDLYIWR